MAAFFVGAKCDGALGEFPEAARVRMRVQGSFGAKNAPQEGTEYFWRTRNSRSLDGAVAVAPTCSG